MTDLSAPPNSTTRALDMPPGSRGKGTGNTSARSMRGRKSGDGSEETIKIAPIKEATKELMRAYKKKELANADYNAMAKAVAERSNANTGILKRLIASSAKGKYQDTRRLIEQQAVLFEMVGEVPGGSVTDSDAGK